LKLKPENLIWAGNTIFALISVSHLLRFFLLNESIKLPLVNIFCIIFGLSCFMVSSLLTYGLSFNKQFQLLIQLFCWAVILYFNFK